MDLFKSEYQRYAAKGKNLIPAILTTFFFIFILPQLFFPVYLLLPHKNMRKMRALACPIIHLVFWFLSNFFFYILYTYKIPYFEQYRVSKSTPWPWEQDPESFKSSRLKIYLNLFINNCVILPLMILHSVETGSSPMETSPDLYPCGFEVLWQLVFFMLIEDSSFYWCHRLCHTGFMYRNIHKKHHEFKTTVGLSSTYTNHFEFLFFNLVPVGLGPVILGKRVHILTNYLWTVIRIVETTDGHSGYDFPWSPFRLLPLAGSSSHHDYHHSHIIGNYSSFFTIWDRLCGTDASYNKYKEKKLA